jgi:hypothetical protein
MILWQLAVQLHRPSISTCWRKDHTLPGSPSSPTVLAPTAEDAAGLPRCAGETIPAVWRPCPAGSGAHFDSPSQIQRRNFVP